MTTTSYCALKVYVSTHVLTYVRACTYVRMCMRNFCSVVYVDALILLSQT